MRKTWLLLIVAALVGGTASGQQRPLFQDAPAISAKVVIASNMNIVLRGATIRVDRGRDLYGVRFLMKNTGTASLANVRLLIIAFSADGVAKSGEVLSQTSLPTPGKELSYEIPLAGKPNSVGDYVALSVLRLKTSKGDEMSVKAGDIMDAIAFGHELSATLVNMTIKPDIDCPGFCIDCRATAQEVCHNGVHSYSCSLSTCTCQFTCNP